MSHEEDAREIGAASDEAREVTGAMGPPDAPPPSRNDPSDAMDGGVAGEPPPAQEEIEDGPAAANEPSGETVAALEQQIRDLEARLDAMMKGGASSAPPPKDANGSARAAAEPSNAEPPPRARDAEFDEFGFDPDFEARATPLLDFLVRTYFRVEARGVSSVPKEGRCLVVANHSSGPLPYDGLLLRAVLRRELDAHPPRDVRWLAEDFVYYLPFVGNAMNRLGAVRACQENAERLLGRGKVVAVFPEGAKGIGKLFSERYRLQRFGRGGFIRLALRTGTPIVPCAIVGGEEANPILARFDAAPSTLGLPYFPITATFPALGPLGLVPAPTKWRMLFGERMSFEGLGPEAAEDEVLVGRLAERVRASIQRMLDDALAERKSVWFG